MDFLTLSREDVTSACKVWQGMVVLQRMVKLQKIEQTDRPWVPAALPYSQFSPDDGL